MFHDIQKISKTIAILPTEDTKLPLQTRCTFCSIQEETKCSKINHLTELKWLGSLFFSFFFSALHCSS